MVDHDPGAAAEEAALLGRIAAGDSGRPMEELFRRYGGRLHAAGLRLLGDPGLAEELVQESFVRLWRQAPAFDPARGTVAGFLFSIARRIAVDLWRRPSSRPFRAEVGAGGASAAGPDQLGPVVDNVVVERALESLTPAHRQVLRLAYGRDLTQAEIARRTGLPLGTVKTRTYHALRALRLALRAQGVDA